MKCKKKNVHEMHILSGVMTISVVLKHLEDQLASTYEPTALC